MNNKPHTNINQQQGNIVLNDLTTRLTSLYGFVVY